MKTLVPIITILVASVSIVHSNTLANDYSEAKHPVESLQSPSTNSLFALVSSGPKWYLANSANQGTTWFVKNLPAGAELVSFFDDTGGLLLTCTREAGKQTYSLLRTRDAGKSWHDVGSFTRTAKIATAWSIQFTDVQNGWILLNEDNSPILFRTSDGGKTVQKETVCGGCINLSSRLRKSGQQVWLTSDRVILLLHPGNQAGWIPTQFEHLTTQDVSLSPEGLLTVMGNVGLDGTILLSEDSGKSFRTVLTVEDQYLESISSTPAGASHICAVGRGRKMHCSRDLGKHWSTVSTLPKNRSKQSPWFRQVLLVDGAWFVIRSGGYLYRSTDNGMHWMEIDILKQAKPDLK